MTNTHFRIVRAQACGKRCRRISMNKHYVGCPLHAHLTHLQQYATCDIRKILSRPHEIQIEVWLNSKQVKNLIKHLPMLCSYTDFYIEIRVFQEGFHHRRHFDGFWTRSENQKNLHEIPPKHSCLTSTGIHEKLDASAYASIRGTKIMRLTGSAHNIHRQVQNIIITSLHAPRNTKPIFPNSRPLSGTSFSVYPARLAFFLQHPWGEGMPCTSRYEIASSRPRRHLPHTAPVHHEPSIAPVSFRRDRAARRPPQKVPGPADSLSAPATRRPFREREPRIRPHGLEGIANAPDRHHRHDSKHGGLAPARATPLPPCQKQAPPLPHAACRLQLAARRGDGGGPTPSHYALTDVDPRLRAV